jgi:AbrB family looped-hinge helix DNA binding protein
MRATTGHEEKLYQSKVDKLGRISLPAAIRESLGVVAGDTVLVKQEGTNHSNVIELPEHWNEIRN